MSFDQHTQKKVHAQLKKLQDQSKIVNAWINESALDQKRSPWIHQSQKSRRNHSKGGSRFSSKIENNNSTLGNFNLSILSADSNDGLDASHSINQQEKSPLIYKGDSINTTRHVENTPRVWDTRKDSR